MNMFADVVVLFYDFDDLVREVFGVRRSEPESYVRVFLSSGFE
jgi:hypothetical protein